MGVKRETAKSLEDSSLSLNKFETEAIDLLVSLDYKEGYPTRKEDYPEFIRHVCRVVERYGIYSQKDTLSIILAWHILGEEFVKDRRAVKLLNDKSGKSKNIYFKKIAFERFSMKEGQER